MVRPSAPGKQVSTLPVLHLEICSDALPTYDFNLSLPVVLDAESKRIFKSADGILQM